MRNGLWGVILVLLMTRGVAAQGLPLAGEKIRLQSTSFSGVALVDDTRLDTLFILIAAQEQPISIPLIEIRRLEVWQETSRSRGALVGIGKGAVLGAAFGLLSAVFSDRPQGSSRTDVFVLTTAVGTAGGLIWGMTAPGGRWLPVTLPSATASPLRHDTREGATTPAAAPARRSRRRISGQNSSSMGAVITSPSTARASSGSSVIRASAWICVSATYSASRVSGHPSWSAIFQAIC
jgi:hypothetical protein